jgi:hypothetical protein
MTNDNSRNRDTFLPFVVRFGEPMEERPLRPLRYDAPRQIAQVLVDGTWVDTPDATGEVEASTRMTKIARETIDD